MKVTTSVLTPVADLKPHPRNYRKHPADQIAHIRKSIEEHGFYRNVVVARDNTILAGHGVVEASKQLGLTSVPVVKLDIDSNSPQALKVLAGENEIRNLSETDTLQLAEILREVNLADEIEGLMGTGFDQMMLSNLVFISRPEDEIKDKNAAAEWLGMPEYEDGTKPFKIVINFTTEKDREEYVKLTKLEFLKKEASTWSTWWPLRSRNDLISLRFDEQVDGNNGGSKPQGAKNDDAADKTVSPAKA